MQVPGSSAFAQQRAPKFFEGDLVKATPLFIILAIVVTVISLILAILPTSNVLIAIIGYLLTPFTVTPLTLTF
jgi:Flp pilus assembly protein TadB